MRPAGPLAINSRARRAVCGERGDEPAQFERLPQIRVAQIVMDYLARGWSPDEMCRQHPYLTQAEAHAAMTLYFDHQAEIDREIEVELIGQQSRPTDPT